MEQYDGHISFESEYGKGTAFTFTFQVFDLQAYKSCKELPTLQIKPTFHPSFPVKDCLSCFKFLSVEDNQVNQFALTSLVQSNFGFELETANHGQECLDKMREERECSNPRCNRKGEPRFPIVFMDYNMPVMGGMEATEEIRKEKKWAKVQVVGITAYSSESYKIQGLEIGMQAVLTKPLKYQDLKECIEEF